VILYKKRDFEEKNKIVEKEEEKRKK